MTRPHYIEDPDTGCWEWQLSRNEHGYGRCLRGREQLAHRVYYIEAKGPIPEGLTLDHLCRNRGCVNPHHLEPVTNAENIRRGAVVKLTAELAREIFSFRAGQLLTARHFGISRSQVQRIRQRLVWAEATEDLPAAGRTRAPIPWPSRRRRPITND